MNDDLRDLVMSDKLKRERPRRTHRLGVAAAQYVGHVGGWTREANRRAQDGVVELGLGAGEPAQEAVGQTVRHGSVHRRGWGAGNVFVHCHRADGVAVWKYLDCIACCLS